LKPNCVQEFYKNLSIPKLATHPVKTTSQHPSHAKKKPKQNYHHIYSHKMALKEVNKKKKKKLIVRLAR
jgi:hypothetical protein